MAGCSFTASLGAIKENCSTRCWTLWARARRHRLRVARSVSTRISKLPVEFLEELGLRDDKYKGIQRLLIPYGDDAVRYRVALSGSNKFKWRSGSSVHLYGLDERERFDGSDEVLIVEGESCAQTAWLHGFPALGVPGASNWKEERDANELDGFSKI